MKLEFSVLILENTLISNFMEIRTFGAKLSDADPLTDGRTDRHDVYSSRFSQFCEHA
jgi:hypothetical protein